MTINLVTLTAPTSPAAEAYRRLRINLMSADRERRLRTVLVVAAAADDEKARVAANLAVAFAKVGKRVVLADCDLRHPAQHSIFGLSNATGVTTVFSQPGGVLPLHATEVPGLQVLPAGPHTEVPSDLLASAAMAQLVERLCDAGDIVLFDAPPVTLASDAAELARQVDAVLLVVAAGRTRRDEAQRAKELLEQVGAHVLGAALVNVAADAELRKYLSA